MTTSHIYSKFIKAWADGVAIEYSDNGRVWGSVCYHHSWGYSYYRFKPIPPKEPDYGAIASNGWFDNSQTDAGPRRWEEAAAAVIKAYEEHQKALREFNNVV